MRTVPPRQRVILLCSLGMGIACGPAPIEPKPVAPRSSAATKTRLPPPQIDLDSGLDTAPSLAIVPFRGPAVAATGTLKPASPLPAGASMQVGESPHGELSLFDISPDGKGVAARYGMRFGILDARTLEVVREISNDSEEHYRLDARFSNDGQWLAYTQAPSGALELVVARVDGTGATVRVKLGELTSKFAFSPTSKHLIAYAYTYDDTPSTLSIVTLADGNQTSVEVDLGERDISAIAIAEPNRVAIATNLKDKDREVWIMSAATDRAKEIRRWPSRHLSSLAFSIDGARIAEAGDTVRVTHVDSGVLHYERRNAHAELVRFDEENSLWHWSGGLVKHNHGGRLTKFFPARGLYNPRFSTEGDLIVVQGRSHVHAWNPTSGRPVLFPSTVMSLDSVDSVAFSADDERIVVVAHGDLLTLAAGDGRLLDKRHLGNAYWRATGPVEALKNTLELYDEHLVAGAVSRDGHHLAAWGERGLEVWDLRTKKRIKRVEMDRADQTEISPDGRLLVASYRKPAQLLTVPQLRVHKTLEAVKTVALIQYVFSPDGRFILGLGEEKRDMVLFDAKTGKVLRTLTMDSMVLSACFSPDGKTIAIGGGNDHATLVNVSTGKKLRSFKHDEYVAALAFSHDAKKLVTFAGRRLTVWQL